jgi:O-antigen/teichoic acid export membrane protein
MTNTIAARLPAGDVEHNHSTESAGRDDGLDPTANAALHGAPVNGAPLNDVVTKEPAAAEERSYHQILKSAALIGGSSVASIAVGVVRTKALAMLLGPAGFGLMGVYGTIVDLTASVAGLGIGSSGVRQIAEAAASGDNERIAQTVAVLRRTVIFTGLLGLTLTIAFARPLSTLTFGNEDHANAILFLSVAVLFRILAAGQGAVIQGMRRISDLAKLNIIGAAIGAVIAIVLVYLFGEPGVAPSLVAVTAAAFGATWWYTRRVAIERPRVSRSELRRESAALLKLGFAFMASSTLMMGAAYAVRTIVLHEQGLDAAGNYGAAWTLGGLYVGILLQAMGADFYPRLVGAADNHPRCNNLVNEQTQVSLLLAGPGIIATLTFAPLVISIFYSGEFTQAVDVLRWICLGIAFRIITWPIGFIIIAKNRQVIFLASEIAWTIVNVGLTFALVRAFGLDGAGMAFFASYVFHGLMIYLIVRRLVGFRWTGTNLRIGFLLLCSLSFLFWMFWTTSAVFSTVIGTVLMILCTVYSLKRLCDLVSPEQLPQAVQQFLKLVRRSA